MTPFEQQNALTLQRKTIKDYITSSAVKRQLAMAMPKHMTVDRFLRVGLNAMLRTPKLLECSKESLYKAMLDLSAYGLEPDGRRAHLIPFKRNFKDPAGKWHTVMEVQLILDYKGIAELVRRSGDVSYIHADCVYEHDEFDYAYGSGAFLKHKPAESDRGERIRVAYSFVKLKDGSEDFVVMNVAEVEKIRAMSKAKDSGPWVDHWPEMAKKTVFRRHSKWLPLSVEVRDAVERDDDSETLTADFEVMDGPEIKKPLFTVDSVDAEVVPLAEAAPEPQEPAAEQAQGSGLFPEPPSNDAPLAFEPTGRRGRK